MANEKESKECSICASVKKTVFACPYCNYESCLACNERVILHSMSAPACVSCKKEFSSDFFHSIFSKAFRDTRYREHREQILYEREKSLLPATQPAAERAKDTVKLSAHMEKARRDLNEARMKVRQAKSAFEHAAVVLRRHEFGIPAAPINQDEDGDEKMADTGGKAVYISACPMNECRGFLTQRLVCGMCGVKACRDCREVKLDDQPHTCNADTVATVQELAKSTKQCPNCRTPIFKIAGCDQMWCTQCNVAFGWNSGRVENGVIHNPHYFEYLRHRGNGEVPRNPNEVRCGGLPPPNFLHNILGMMDNQSHRSCASYLTNVYRGVNHIRQVVMRGLPTVIDNVCNQDLRVDFLLKNCSEQEFKVRLQRREKERNKQLEQRAILDTYCNVAQDLLNELYHNGTTQVHGATFWSEEKSAVAIIEEQAIRQYTQQAWQKMNDKFGSRISCPL